MHSFLDLSVALNKIKNTQKMSENKKKISTLELFFAKQLTLEDVPRGAVVDPEDVE